MADKVINSFPAGQGKLVPVDHTGPASYTAGGETLGSSNLQTGITVAGLGSLDFVDCEQLTVSGNYQVLVQPAGTGERKTAKLIWLFGPGVNGQGITVVQNAAGVGMTPGTVVPIVFAGGTGSGAAGSVTVLTATTISINVTNPGTYSVAPTATISGTGGTPATLTVALATAGAQVTAGVNLTSEVAKLVYIGR